MPATSHRTQQRRGAAAGQPETSRPPLNLKPNLLQECERILAAHHGCSTPFEDFFFTLVIESTIRPVTPASVREMLAEFEENFDDMTSTSKEFLARYAEALAPA